MGIRTSIHQQQYLYPMVPSPNPHYKGIFIVLHHRFVHASTNWGISPPLIFVWASAKTHIVVVALLLQTGPHEWMNPSTLGILRWLLLFYMYIPTNKNATIICSLKLQLSHHSQILQDRYHISAIPWCH